MNIVNFTPQSAFVGGIIIGLAVIIFFVGNGRLAGISGISLLSTRSIIATIIFKLIYIILMI
tara:strand:- start:1048 stop:1233 length:186 start_codon:yes stop_codon:yes gene_type:complete